MVDWVLNTLPEFSPNKMCNGENSHFATFCQFSWCQQKIERPNMKKPEIPRTILQKATSQDKRQVCPLPNVFPYYVIGDSSWQIR